MKTNIILLSTFLLTFIGPMNAQQNSDLTKEFTITNRYVNLPVQNKLSTQHVKVSVEGEIIREFDIQLAEEEPDFWVFIDLDEMLGKQGSIELSKPNKKGISLVYFSDQFAGFDSLYNERLRPQFHFSSMRGWNNDPNGLVYQNGIYHLYYQHNPYGWDWGNMHWGHAISKDLVHWKELPTALIPKSYGDMAFSGSAVVDTKNTSGFSKNESAPLVAAYTSTGRGECIVYSLDGGKTFTEYEKNPVIVHEGRDPKIFWYEPGNHWVMALYDDGLKKGATGSAYRDRVIQIYTSENLKDWTYQSSNAGYYECPELFELPVDENSKDKKWIMYGANGQYQIGNFNGKIFSPESPKLEFCVGNQYASQTYNNTPDGRRIQVAWGNGIESPGMPFNQIMLFPVELSLKTTEDGLRMLPKPIREISLLHKKEHSWLDVKIAKDKPFKANVKTDLLHIKAEFQLLDDYEMGMTINGFDLNYNIINNKLNDVFLRPIDNKITLEILVDRTSIEIFANDGSVYIIKAHIADQDELGIEVHSKAPTWSSKSSTLIKKLEIYELNTSWGQDY